LPLIFSPFVSDLCTPSSIHLSSAISLHHDDHTVFNAVSILFLCLVSPEHFSHQSVTEVFWTEDANSIKYSMIIIMETDSDQHKCKILDNVPMLKSWTQRYGKSLVGENVIPRQSSFEVMFEGVK